MRFSTRGSAAVFAAFGMMAAGLWSVSCSGWAAEQGRLPPMLRKAAADCGVDPRAVTVSVVALDGLRMPEGGRMPVSYTHLTLPTICSV